VWLRFVTWAKADRLEFDSLTANIFLIGWWSTDTAFLFVVVAFETSCMIRCIIWRDFSRRQISLIDQFKGKIYLWWLRGRNNGEEVAQFETMYKLNKKHSSETRKESESEEQKDQDSFDSWFIWKRKNGKRQKQLEKFVWCRISCLGSTASRVTCRDEGERETGRHDVSLFKLQAARCHTMLLHRE